MLRILYYYFSSFIYIIFCGSKNKLIFQDRKFLRGFFEDTSQKDTRVDTFFVHYTQHATPITENRKSIFGSKKTLIAPKICNIAENLIK